MALYGGRADRSSHFARSHKMPMFQGPMERSDAGKRQQRCGPRIGSSPRRCIAVPPGAGSPGPLKRVPTANGIPRIRGRESLKKCASLPSARKPEAPKVAAETRPKIPLAKAQSSPRCPSCSRSGQANGRAPDNPGSKRPPTSRTVKGARTVMNGEGPRYRSDVERSIPRGILRSNPFKLRDSRLNGARPRPSERSRPEIPALRILPAEHNDSPQADRGFHEAKAEIPIKQEERESIPDARRHCRGLVRYCPPAADEECGPLRPPEQGRARVHTEGAWSAAPPADCPAQIVSGPQSVTVLRGECVTLAIGFRGRPTPRVTWMKAGRVLGGGVERCRILSGSEMSVVTLGEVTADDSGKYTVRVENEAGGDSRFASVAVVGFPEPPGGQPTPSEVTDHSLVLSWYGSMYDGGSVITGYQVEMASLPERSWQKVSSSVNTSCAVQGLSRGQRYVFRVRAENRYGLSHPSKESRPVCLDDFLRYDTSDDDEPGEVPGPPIGVGSGAEFSEQFDLKEEVGKGRFGVVYRCVSRGSGRPRAAKVIRCLKRKDKEKVRQEIGIMSRLRHPKLMQVLAAFEDGRNMIMVMEFISGGELFERVIADDFLLTEHDCVLFTRQICTGVAYMHRQAVLHLDLKPENILCKTRTSHKIKIIDFGLARVHQPELRVLFGTPEFVAPEVIGYEPVGPPSDLWSVGVICYVLLSGLSPFMGDSDPETFSNITRAEVDFDDDAFKDISEEAKHFISGLLLKAPKSRMTAEECLGHPWLATCPADPRRVICTEKLKRFIIRRKWQKSGTAIRALGRMVSLSRSSAGSGSSCESPPSPTGSRPLPTSRSETDDSDVFRPS